MRQITPMTPNDKMDSFLANSSMFFCKGVRGELARLGNALSIYSDSDRVVDVVIDALQDGRYAVVIK